jgi:hypothetical protein
MQNECLMIPVIFIGENLKSLLNWKNLFEADYRHVENFKRKRYLISYQTSAANAQPYFQRLFSCMLLSCSNMKNG